MLDQFTLSIPKEDIIHDTKLKTDGNGKSVCLWINEEELNNFMDNLYHARNGESYLEDGEYVRLYESDIDELLKLWHSGELRALDVDNMERALNYLKELTHQGEIIFYGCSF